VNKHSCFIVWKRRNKTRWDIAYKVQRKSTALAKAPKLKLLGYIVSVDLYNPAFPLRPVMSDEGQVSDTTPKLAKDSIWT
jgi:hypothetical protein